MSIQQRVHPPSVESAMTSLFPGASWNAEPLGGGMTNRNYRVDVLLEDSSTKTFVVQEQLPGELAKRVGIKRENQFQALKQVAGLGLAPEVVFHDPVAGTVVVEYVHGKLIREVDDRRTAITHVARLLSAFHGATRGATLEGFVSDPYHGTLWLYDQVQRSAPGLAAEFRWAIEVVERIRRSRGSYERSLCHADVSDGNVIITPQRAVLIDWEYVGAGDPYYDLADFAEKAQLSESEEHALVAEYDGGVESGSMALVRVYRFVSMLREGLWSVQAGSTGFIDFDHASYADECLSRMTAIAENPTFGDYVAAIHTSTIGAAR